MKCKICGIVIDDRTGTEMCFDCFSWANQQRRTYDKAPYFRYGKELIPKFPRLCKFWHYSYDIYDKEMKYSCLADDDKLVGTQTVCSDKGICKNLHCFRPIKELNYEGE